MKICSFGDMALFLHNSITTIDFSGDDTILEYDVLFLNLSSLLNGYFSTNGFD